MKLSRVFISHSSQDKEFAQLVVAGLRSPNMAPWIDSEQIVTGDDIFDRLGQGLQLMDVMVFLVSKASLESEWVKLEVKYAVKREINERRVLVLPFIIDDTPIDALDWFLSHRNVSCVAANPRGAEHIVNTVRQALQRRSVPVEASAQESEFRYDPRVNKLIENVGLGDWNAARDAAIEMLKATDEFGENELFQVLFTYIDCPDEDLRWGAIIAIESFAQLAPWLFNHELLSRMANHQDFSIRSSAASICFDLAHFAPDRVPIDVLLKLSTHDEDWYVTTPATAALKAMTRWRPAVLRVFFSRLHSPDPDAREYVAQALADIARTEPEILEPEDLIRAFTNLEQMGDKAALAYIAEALSKVRQVDRSGRYKYSAF